MEVTFSDRACIAFEHLPDHEMGKALKLVEALRDYPNDPYLKGKISSLRNVDQRKLYLAKLSTRFRVIFEFSGEGIKIIEVASHDRLSRFLRGNKGGVQ